MGDAMHRQAILAAALAGLCIATESVAQTADVLSFTQNTAIEYSTKHHVKAAGLHITLRYPATWGAVEGNRPHIIQKFVSAGGKGLELCMLLVVRSPEPITDADAGAALEVKALRQYVPPGAFFIAGERTTLDGIPAGIISYKATQHVAGQSVTMYNRNYMMFYDSKSIQLQCGVGGRSDAESLAKRFHDYSRSVFTLIANSLVVQNKWLSKHKR